MSDKSETTESAADARRSSPPTGSTVVRAAEIIEEYANLLRESSERPDLEWDDREAEADYDEMVKVAKEIRRLANLAAATVERLPLRDHPEHDEMEQIACDGPSKWRTATWQEREYAGVLREIVSSNSKLRCEGTSAPKTKDNQ